MLVFLELAAAETATENQASPCAAGPNNHDQALTDSDSFLRGGAMTGSLLERAPAPAPPSPAAAAVRSTSHTPWRAPAASRRRRRSGRAPSSSSSSSSSALPLLGVLSVVASGRRSTGVATTVGCDDDFRALSDAARAAELLLAVRSAAPRRLGTYQRSPAHLRLGHVFENLRDMSRPQAESVSE